MPRGVYKRTAEHNAAIGAAQKGKKHKKHKKHVMTQEHYPKMSAASRKRFEDPAECERQRVNNIRRFENPAEHEKSSASAKEAANRPELKIKKSIALKDNPKVIAAAKKSWQDSEYREKQIAAHTGKHPSKETLKKMCVAAKKRWDDPGEHEKTRIASKRNWQDPEYVEKVVKAIIKASHTRPNNEEEFVDDLLQKIFPGQWKYVGSGDFRLGRRNPDFINTTGQKKIIEFFGDYYHSKTKIGRTNAEEERQRIEYFAKYGYQTLIIWGHDLHNSAQLIEKIKAFA